MSRVFKAILPDGRTAFRQSEDRAYTHMVAAKYGDLGWADMSWSSSGPRAEQVARSYTKSDHRWEVAVIEARPSSEKEQAVSNG